MARVLCVDDDVNAIKLKRAILERAGHKVDQSTSAESAIEMLAAFSYDAIVTDWRLGEQSARRVILAAKQETETPVVVVSGYVSEAFQAPGAVADLYLDKPVDPSELLQILDALLTERQH